MNQKRLGKTDLMVNPIGLGCMGLSHAYGAAKSHDESIDFLKKSFKTGYNFFDTADVYTGKTGGGVISNNEELVGMALNEVRDYVVIASKFGITIEGITPTPDASPESIQKSIEGTLKRLNVDCLDLYCQHRIDGRDIGAYNTCMHGCKYCYANNIEIVKYLSLTTDNIMDFHDN